MVCLLIFVNAGTEQMIFVFPSQIVCGQIGIRMEDVLDLEISETMSTVAGTSGI